MKKARLGILILLVSAAITAGLFTNAAFTTAVNQPLLSPFHELIICGNEPTVYYVDGDNIFHPFPDETTYLSWYPDFSGVQHWEKSICDTSFKGTPITLRPGTFLVRFRGKQNLYAVSAPNILRLIRRSSIAQGLFGRQWNRTGVTGALRILAIQRLKDYKIGSTIVKTSDYNRQQELETCDSIHRCFGFPPPPMIDTTVPDPEPLPDIMTTTSPPSAPSSTNPSVPVTPTPPSASPPPSSTVPSTLTSAAIPAPAPYGGNFRIQCGFSHGNFDDPIVYPGQRGASHLHMYYGNTVVNAFTTTENILESGDSTCHGRTLNRTAYWVPALKDANDGIIRSMPINIYYKSGSLNHRTIRPLPTGLRVIAGTGSAGPNDPQPRSIVRWTCLSQIDSIRREEDFSQRIPYCAQGDTLLLTVMFPQCWDGVNLDSPNHKSHMAYPTSDTCPASHPVPVPHITYAVDYPVTTAGGTTLWRLSSDHYDAPAPGGYSAHGDWFMGWNPTIMKTFVTHCINGGRDCSGGNLGNGTTLPWFIEGSGVIEGQGTSAPTPVPTPAPAPAPAPTPAPTPTSTSAPTQSIVVTNDGAYVRWTVANGVDQNGGTMFLFSRTPQPVYGGTNVTAYHRSQGAVTDGYVNQLYGPGTYYVRVCAYNATNDTCHEYSNEVQAQL